MSERTAPGELAQSPLARPGRVGRGRFIGLTALVLAVSLVAPSCDGGCGPCAGSNDEQTLGPDPDIPTEWSELTLGYARQLPSEAHGILVARGFAEVASSFQAIKGRIRDFFDLGQVEEEIRNTFGGLDINRHVTFRQAGLVYDGGFAVSLIRQQVVIAFYISNSEPFFARAAEVLRRQPFNLRAPVARRAVGEAEIHLYAPRANEEPEFAVMVDRDLAFLIPRSSRSSTVEQVATALAETTPETSLAAHADFEDQLGRFAAYPGFAFIDTSAASAFYADRYADQLSATSAHALEQVSTAVRSIAGGARLEGLELTFEAYIRVEPDVAEAAAGIEVEADANPQLDRFFLPSTFAAVRLGADPWILWQTILRFQGEGGAEALNDGAAALEEFLGVSLQEQLAPTLTGQGLIMVNRLAPLSILRAEGLADWADALDLFAVFELAQRQQALSLLDALVTANSEEYSRDQADGAIRYTTGRGEHGFGNVYVTDDRVIVGAERMSRVATRLIRETAEPGEADLGELGDATRELLSAPVATGAFLKFDRLVDIVTILNYPQAIRDLLGFLDTFALTLAQEGEGLHVRGALTLTPTSE